MEQNAVPKAVRRLVIISSAFLVASVLISGFSAYATLAAPLQAPHVPDTVGFEGQLADSNGDPVTDGNYTITFKLYSLATGGSPVWNETQTVSVEDGLYSVQLGTVTDLDADDFDGDRWLGVQVSGDSEMTPRIPISAVPFALNAEQARGLQGRAVSTATPTDGDVLTWDNTASNWEPDIPGARTFPELDEVDNNEDPQDFFSQYRSGATLSQASDTTIDVSPGEIMIDGRMRRNATDVTVSLTGDMETGTSVQANTTYDVYALADVDESTFDLIISDTTTGPYGSTYYRKIGQFRTNNNTEITGVVTTYDNNVASGLVEIASYEVTGSSVSQIDFDDIPGDYKTLVVKGQIRPATNEVHLRLRLNGDTNSNYNYSFVGVTDGGGDAQNANSGKSYILLGGDIGNDTYYATGLDIEIPNYAETTLYKNVQATVSINSGATNSLTYMFAGQWKNTSAITKLTFFMSSGNIDVGSYVTLYAIR